MQDFQNTRHGFTLLELSIVIAIVALIAGGVLIGRDMLATSSNRALIAQIQSISAMVNSFKTKYDCLPGDCTNSVALNLAANNGNGNGAITTIEEGTGSFFDFSLPSGGQHLVYSHGATTYEGRSMWYSLQAAGMVDLSSFTTDNPATPFDLMKSKKGNAGFVVGAINGLHYISPHATELVSGTTANYKSSGISPADAAYIFNKMNGGILTIDADGRYNPTALVNGEKIIAMAGDDRPGLTNGNDAFFVPPSRGAGGESANYCINTSVTPEFFNTANPSKICGILVRADF